MLVATAIAGNLITHNAGAALMFPLAMDTADVMAVDSMPFIITVMIAASASFATPIGYQTNLMVYGPGGYRFSDYLRLGLPLVLIVGVTTVILAPIMYPF